MLFKSAKPVKPFFKDMFLRLSYAIFNSWDNLHPLFFYFFIFFLSDTSYFFLDRKIWIDLRIYKTNIKLTFTSF